MRIEAKQKLVNAMLSLKTRKNNQLFHGNVILILS